MRLVRTLVIFAIALAGLTFTGCPADSRWARKYQSVAEVGERKISRAQFISAMTASGIARLKQKKERDTLGEIVLGDLTERALVLVDAKKKGISVKPAWVDHVYRRNTAVYTPASLRETLHLRNLTPGLYRAELEEQLLVEEYWTQALSQKPLLKPGAIEAYARKLESKEKEKDRVRARHILLSTEEEAQWVLKQIRQPKLTFAEAAQRYSKAPEAKSGGELGWFSPGQMPAFFDVCFSLQKSQISDVVQSEHGFHLFQIVDLAKPEATALANLKNLAKRQLEDEHELQKMKHILKRLRKEIHVQLHPEAIAHAISSLPIVKPKRGSTE